MLKVKKKISYILLLLAAISFITQAAKFNDRYISKYDHVVRGKIYSASPYVRGSQATTSIGDDYLFAFAGYIIFIQGGDPSSIQFEVPPLGEYLIGFSIWLFGNEWVISLIYGLLLLIFTYKLAKNLFNNIIISSLSILLISIDGLYLRSITVSLLDLPQSLFILISLYCYSKAIKDQTGQYFLTSLFLGCALSIKFFPAIIFFIGLLLLNTYFLRKKDLVIFIISLLLIPIVYISSYSMYFVHNHSLMDFLKFQKWVLVWRSGNPIVLGNIFLSLLTGKYRSWWDSSWPINNEWTILQAVLFIFGLLGIWFVDLRKRKSLYIYSGLICIFILYLAVLTTGVSRYIYPVLPFMAIFTANALTKLYKVVKEKLGIICYTNR